MMGLPISPTAPLVILNKFLTCYFFVFISVIPQDYDVDVHAEYVLKGNDGLLKCYIPSYVSDFVSVVSWLSEDGIAYFPNNAFGKCHNHNSFTVLVVPQHYKVDVHDESVLGGNNAVFKCVIPSFVADFVSTRSWLDDAGNAYFPHQSLGNNFIHGLPF